MAAQDLLSTSAAAAMLDVSDDTLRRWVEQRKIRHIKLPSGQIRFRVEDIEAVLHPVEPVAPAEAVG